MQEVQGGHLPERQIVYVASSMTNASDEYRVYIKKFKQELRSATATVVLEWLEFDSPVVLSNFFEKDMNNVRNCSVMIAIVDEPSIGVGMEIMEAIHSKKPTLCLYRESSNVSRLLQSAQISAGFKICSYKTLNEAVGLAADFINEYRLHGS